MKKLLLLSGLIISIFLGNNLTIAQSLTIPTGTVNIGPVLIGESSDGSHNFTVTGSGYSNGAALYVDALDSRFAISVNGPGGPFLTSVTYYADGSGNVNQVIHVKYTPTTIGQVLDNLEFYDFESFTFQLKEVRGVGSGPDIKLEGRESGSDPWDEIVNGESTPSVAEGTDFGDALANSETIDRTFQISNISIGGLSGNLVLDEYTTGKYVEITGTNADQFSVTVEPTSPVSPSGGITTYTVRFSPTSAGIKDAQINIESNDPDESPFTFAIQGIGTLVLPDAPTANAATSVNHDSFYANWTQGAGGTTTGYYLDVVTDNGFNNFVSGYESLDVGNVLTYLVNGLDPNTDYFYRLRAYNESGESGDSNIETLKTAPPIPVANSATNINAESFYANWSFVTGATSYRLDVNTSPDFTGTAILDNEIVTATYKNVTGLTAGGTYYYRVRSYNGNSSGNSNIVTTITYCNAPTATPATNVLTSSFTANWTVPTGGTPDSYKLDVSTSSSFLTFLPGFENLTVNGTSKSVTGLSQNAIYYYRVRSVNVAGSSENSNTIMVQLPGTTNWTGSINSSWELAGNWDNGVPGPYTDVTIVPGFNQPFINTNQACNNLTMQAGSELDIISGKTLVVNGDFVMKSTALGCASLVEYGGLQVNGTSTIESYLSKDRWHFVSPTLSDQQSAVFEGVYLKFWDESIQDWEYITSMTYPLTEGTGYAAWNYDENITINYSGGAVNQGPYSPTLTYTPTGDGFNLIGNPYPSGIDWDDGSWTKTNLDGTIYVWDGVQNITWNGSVGGLTNGIIPIGQAFSVKANAANPAIGMTDAARGHSPFDPYKEKEEVPNLIEMFAYGNEYSDAAYINFNGDATDGFDNAYDGYKRWGIDEAPQLFTVANDINLAVNVLGELTENKIIQVGYRVGAAGEYTIDVTNMESFVEPVTIYLKDLMTGEMINVTDQSSYTFAASPEDDIIRFELHFTTTVGIEDQLENSNIYIYSNDNSVYVRNNMPSEGGIINVYNISGTEILTSQLEDIPLNKIDLVVKSGFYVVQVTTDNEVYSQKVFIK